MINLSYAEYDDPITRMCITATSDTDNPTELGTLSALVVRPVLANFDLDWIDDELHLIIGDDVDTDDMCDEDALIITNISAIDAEDETDIYADLVAYAYQIACKTYALAGMEVFLVGEAAQKLQGVDIILKFGS